MSNVPATGGEVRLLVSHPAHESRPLYSPDGRRLAFVSTRTGSGDVYVLTFATGLAPRPVDIAVSRRPGEDPEGVDSQLDAAVKARLAQFSQKR